MTKVEKRSTHQDRIGTAVEKQQTDAVRRREREDDRRGGESGGEEVERLFVGLLKVCDGMTEEIRVSECEGETDAPSSDGRDSQTTSAPARFGK